jgi:hypothetical protein
MATNNQQYEVNPWSPVLPPSVNGGLYTGEPFMKDAPWANVKVKPTWAYMTNINLRSSIMAPPAAFFQMPVNIRPGNNSDDRIEGILDFIGDENFGPFNFKCIKCIKKAKEDEDTSCKEIIIPII